MAGAIQGALSNLVSIASGAVVAGKKLSEDEKQAKIQETKAAQAEADYQRKITAQAKDIAMEADLVSMGADPDKAHAFMLARGLGLDTKKFGNIRTKGGKFAGSYSSMAERLAQGSLADSLTAKVINQKGFAERLLQIKESDKVKAALKAKEGGSK